MKSSISVSVCFLISFTHATDGAPLVWPVGNGGNGHAYELITDQLPWPDARAAANVRPAPAGFGLGHLATISNAEENQFLVDKFAVSTPFGFYMGFTDELLEGEWRWIDDTPGIWQDPDNFLNPLQTAYTNWAPGEPNDAQSEDYGILNGGIASTWNDGQTAPPGPYVIEWSAVPEPTTLAIAALGTSGLLIALRRNLTA